MPWVTPSLPDVRRRNRDYISSRLQVALVPNSITRIVADAQAGTAHLNLQYLDWLADQLMPDRAETEWLERQGIIWLKNQDGTKGRKAPTPASGFVTATGIEGTIVPIDTEMRIGTGSTGVLYRTVADIAISNGPTLIPVTAIDAGTIGNLEPGDQLAISPTIANVDTGTLVVELSGGTDQETDDELRVRILERIQKPPMGGDADDYVQWALAFPGVTRAWCSPKEMGVGTVTVRIMMDDLRANQEGFPGLDDVDRVQAWIDQRRPVTTMDCFVLAPLREPVSFQLSNLQPDDSSTVEMIEQAVRAMLMERAAPAFAVDGIAREAQTIYASWVSEAVSSVSNVDYFDLVMENHVMPSKGHLAVLGNVNVSPG